MSKPTEHDIESLFSAPDSISSERKQWILSWLKKDKELNEVAEFYEKFNQKLKEVSDSKNKCRAVPLVITVEKQTRRKKKRNGFVLAAQTTAVSGTSYKIVKTLLSEEHHTLLRVLHDESKRVHTIHVISSYLDDSDVVLIEDESGKLFISSAGSKLEIPESEYQEWRIKEWNQCNVHLPLCRLYFYRDRHYGNVTYSFGKAVDEIDQEKVEIEISKERIAVKIPVFSESFGPGRVVIQTDRMKRFGYLSEGYYEFPAEYLDEGNFTLYYFR